MVLEYLAFIDKGEFHPNKIPPGYKLIHVHMVFDVKPDARNRTQCVGDGHLKDVPIKLVYSGVVLLNGL